MSFLTILPLAIVMVAGPQLLSAIFLATSENWRRNSAAYVFGAFLSISLVVTIAYLVGDVATNQGTSNDTLYVVVLVLLLVAMVNVYRTREESEPPKWMGKLERANPRFSFRLGFLLLGFFPTDILTSSAVGSFLAGNGDPLVDALPFVGLTLLFLALPSLVLLAFGDRGKAFLPKARDWMNTNSWVVNEVVILLFIALTLNNLLG
ncbi:GAP family protein [Haladaptatus sp. NG-WS-4]